MLYVSGSPEAEASYCFLYLAAILMMVKFFGYSSADPFLLTGVSSSSGAKKVS